MHTRAHTYTSMDIYLEKCNTKNMIVSIKLITLILTEVEPVPEQEDLPEVLINTYFLYITSIRYDEHRRVCFYINVMVCSFFKRLFSKLTVLFFSEHKTFSHRSWHLFFSNFKQLNINHTKMNNVCYSTVSDFSIFTTFNWAIKTNETSRRVVVACMLALSIITTTEVSIVTNVLILMAMCHAKLNIQTE